MKRGRFFALAAAAAFLTSCGGGSELAGTPADNAHPSSSAGGLTLLSAFTARDDATGALVHILPPRSVLTALRNVHGAHQTLSTNNLVYSGGPVQYSAAMQIVYWGSAWTTKSGDPDGVMSRLAAFCKGVGGGLWLNTVTQYKDSNGFNAYNGGSICGRSYVDTTSQPPPNPSQAQLAAEAFSAAVRIGVGKQIVVSNYVVALPHGIVPVGFISTYCAYHSTTTLGPGGPPIAWTNLPYMPDAGPDCGAGLVNNPGTLDGVTIVAGHEQAETETDPIP